MIHFGVQLRVKKLFLMLSWIGFGLSVSGLGLSNQVGWAALPSNLQASPQANSQQGVVAKPLVELVQSAPLETDLIQAGIPLTSDVWVDMIRGAKSSLDLAHFYISAKTALPKAAGSKKLIRSPLEPVLEEMEKAAQRGVKIRFLVSSSLINEDLETLSRIKKMRGILVRTYDLSTLTGGVHHAKYWIVDGKEAFIGSQNFDWRSITQIHELGARVRDVETARQLGRIFEVDWKAAKSGEVPATFLAPTLSNVPANAKKIELVASPAQLTPPETRPAIQALTELIQGAKKSLHIQLLDYSPVSGAQVYWPELDNAIRAMALRGVKVQMLLANSSSTLRAMDYLKSLTMIPGVEIKLATLPAYSGGNIPYARLIHSKYLIVDDETLWLGTSNWSKGYFYNSRNVELIFREPELAQKGELIFQKLWNSPYSVKIEQRP